MSKIKQEGGGRLLWQLQGEIGCFLCRLAGRLGPRVDGRKDSDEEETGERRGLAGRLGPRVDGRKDSDEEENGERDEGKVRLLMCTLNLYLQRLRS